MAESYEHAMTMYDIIGRLERHYAGRDDAHFGINSFIYYVEGEPGRRVAPDVYAVFGVRPRPRSERRSYRLWEEGAPPAIVFEITSPKTRSVDLVRKRNIYAGMGVREYVLFDPMDEYLRPRLRGFVLQDGAYVELERGEEGSIVSSVLGARLVPNGRMLDLIDLETGERWLNDAEAERQVAQQERERAEQAEAELRALRAQLQAQRGTSNGTNGASGSIDL